MLRRNANEWTERIRKERWFPLICHSDAKITFKRTQTDGGERGIPENVSDRQRKKETDIQGVCVWDEERKKDRKKERKNERIKERKKERKKIIDRIVREKLSFVDI